MKVKPFFKRIGWFGVFNIVLCILFILSLILEIAVSSAITDVNYYKRWTGSSSIRFTHVAVYMSDSDSLSEDDIYSFRNTLSQKLSDASLEAADGGSLFNDAFYAAGNLSAKGNKASSSTTVYGLGGDFFSFHSFSLVSGSYISDDDLMQDRVILTENLAWRLYGATDLAGMTLTIGDRDYYIAGVVRLPEDFFTKKTLETDEILFMSYDALSSINSDIKISGYEIVLPDAVDNYGKAIITENFPCGGGSVIQYRSRYSLKNLFSVIGDFGLRSTSKGMVNYPFWENAVRISEDYAALFLVLSIFFGICPAITLIVFAIKWVILLVKSGKTKIKISFENAIESKREKDYKEKFGR